MIDKDANVKQLVLIHFWPEMDEENYVLETKEIFGDTIKA